MPRWIDKLYTNVLEVISSRQGHRFFSLATVLRAAALPYGRLVKGHRNMYRRGWLRPYVLPCPVISIGNLEVGGTGKTPMTIHLAKFIRELGYRPVVLSRGYKGNRSQSGAVVSDGRVLLLSAAEAGDEPFLIASLVDQIPVIIGRDRIDAGKFAIERFQPHVLILDDGFQHLRLHRNVDVVLLDSDHPFGNRYLLPRGRLREPIAALARSHALVLTRCGEKEPSYYKRLSDVMVPRPVFQTFHRLVVRGVMVAGTRIAEMSALKPFHDQLTEKCLFAFSGLARNKSFWGSLVDQGAKLMGTLGFDDHHNYTVREMTNVAAAAKKTKSGYIVTTEKDFVRLPKGICLEMDLIVAGVCIDFKADHTRWCNFIEQQLQILV